MPCRCHSSRQDAGRQAQREALGWAAGIRQALTLDADFSANGHEVLPTS